MNDKQLGGLKKAVALACAAVLAAAVTTGCAKKAKPAVVKVALDQTTVSLLAGTAQALTPTVTVNGVTQTTSAVASPSTASSSPAAAQGVWNTSNPDVATVDASGTVTAVTAGTCEVTYAYQKSHKAACSVTVSPSSIETSVLMYHSISDVAGNKLCVPAGNFETEMKWLADNGYATLSLDQLYNAVSAKKPFPAKSVVVTLDDGYADNYTGVYPVMKKYNLHATIFMITSKIDQPGFLSAQQLKEMSDSGFISVECHTVTHPDLDTLSYSAQMKELKDSKATLENLLGKKVEYLAYPTGRYNKDTIALAQSLGYKMCFKMEGGSGTNQNAPYEFPRAFVDKNLNTLIDAANGLGD